MIYHDAQYSAPGTPLLPSFPRAMTHLRNLHLESNMQLNTFRLFHNFLFITMKSLQIIQIIWILIQTLPISSTCQLQLYITPFISFVLERHNHQEQLWVETILSTRSGHNQACRLVGCGDRSYRSLLRCQVLGGAFLNDSLSVSGESLWRCTWSWLRVDCFWWVWRCGNLKTRDFWFGNLIFLLRP